MNVTPRKPRGVALDDAETNIVGETNLVTGVTEEDLTVAQSFTQPAPSPVPPIATIVTSLAPEPPPVEQTAPVSLDSLTIESGSLLGDYRVEKRLGKGGWGMVFSAVHPLIGKRVAIKVLNADLCRDQVALQRFIDEARAVNQIAHPNIVDIFAFGETMGGRSYFVMEYLQGETLWQRLRLGPMKVDDIAAIVRPLSRALEAAHAKGIIHRDLKPENIFLVERPGEPANVKLLDFGVAKLGRSKRHENVTGTGEIVGTPLYIAPEQARARNIDARVDIYALGGIIFELLTGRLPFAYDNTADMIAAHLTQEPPRPSSLVAGVPPEIDELVLEMLAKDPAMRPSLADVRDVLDHIGQRQPTSPPASIPASPSPRFPKAPRLFTSFPEQVSTVLVRFRSRRWMLIAAAAVVIGIVVGVALAPSKHKRARAPVAADAAVVAEPPPVPARPSGRLILNVTGAGTYSASVDHLLARPGGDGTFVLDAGEHEITVTAPGMADNAFRVKVIAGDVVTQKVFMVARRSR